MRHNKLLHGHKLHALPLTAVVLLLAVPARADTTDQGITNINLIIEEWCELVIPGELELRVTQDMFGTSQPAQDCLALYVRCNFTVMVKCLKRVELKNGVTYTAWATLSFIGPGGGEDPDYVWVIVPQGVWVLGEVRICANVCGPWDFTDPCGTYTGEVTVCCQPAP